MTSTLEYVNLFHFRLGMEYFKIKYKIDSKIYNKNMYNN